MLALKRGILQEERSHLGSWEPTNELISFVGQNLKTPNHEHVFTWFLGQLWAPQMGSIRFIQSMISLSRSGDRIVYCLACFDRISWGVSGLSCFILDQLHFRSECVQLDVLVLCCAGLNAKPLWPWDSTYRSLNLASQASQVGEWQPSKKRRADYVIRQNKTGANTQRLDTVIVHWGGAPQLLVIFSWTSTSTILRNLLVGHGWPCLAIVQIPNLNCSPWRLMALDGWDLWKCRRLLAREASKNHSFMYSGVSICQRPVDTHIYIYIAKCIFLGRVKVR